MTGRNRADPSDEERQVYRFEDLEIDVGGRTIRRRGVPVQVEPKAFSVIVFLLRRAGRVVPRDELLDAVWGHRHVTPGVLTRAVAQLRAALGDDPQRPRYIQTRHALGYCFVGQLLPATGLEPQPAPAGTEAEAAVDDAAQPRVPGDAVSIEPRPASAPARAPQRSRHGGHWLLAPLLAAVVLAISVWSARQEAPAPAATSIAIMPFTNLGGDRDQDYFAEGLALEMHDALAGVKGLKVSAQLSPAAAAQREADVRALGRRLGVATVLDASVRRDGRRVRITARLSDTGNGYTLWSRTYDRESAGIFDLQNEIAREVVSSLMGALPDAEGARLAKRLEPTHSAAAFDAYLSGLKSLKQWGGGGGAEASILHFQRALSVDAGFARAQAGICRAELWRYEAHHAPAAFDNAAIACARAANMDGTIGEVDLALGDLYRTKGDFDRAARHYRALEHDPGLAAAAAAGIAKLHVAKGETALAMRRFEEALAIDPSDAQTWAELGYQQYLLGTSEQALAAYRKAVELRPDRGDYWDTFGALSLARGDKETAARAFERSVAIEPNPISLANLGTLRYQAGDYAGAAARYRQALAVSPGDYMLWGSLGDALIADPSTSEQSVAPFRKAETLAADYLGAHPGDAVALAAHAWYRAAQGRRDDPAEVLQAVRAAESAVGNEMEAGEVAIFNAHTLAAVGRTDAARAQLAIARRSGISRERIETNGFFRNRRILDGTGPARGQRVGGPDP